MRSRYPYSRFPGKSASRTSVPVGLRPNSTSSPIRIFRSRDVRRPSGTLMEKNSSSSSQDGEVHHKLAGTKTETRRSGQSELEQTIHVVIDRQDLLCRRRIRVLTRSL